MKDLLRMYSTSEDVLYKVYSSAWSFCDDYLADFSKFKSYYTKDVITAAFQALDDAKALPDPFQNIKDRKAARKNLIQATRLVQANWQMLKAYIINAFPKYLVKTKLEAAGSPLYGKASVDNWTGVNKLIDAAILFMDANPDLTLNGNMPPEFPATFKTAADDCKATAKIFFDLDFAKKEATVNKIKANNTLYTSLILMLNDGKIIFKDNLAVKRNFIFSRLVSTFKAEGSASLRGTIVNNMGVAIAGATITSKDQQYTATTDKKGHYRITRMAEGSYTFIVTCAGYTPVEQVATLKAGTASTVNIELGALMKKVA